MNNSNEPQKPESSQTATGGPTLLTVWVVRNSAFSIQCGGLERLFVYFTKPVYVFTKPLTSKQRDTPFGDISEKEGLYDKYGWIEPNQKTWVPKLSVGNWIGYENAISDFIWGKLQEHFHNEPFSNWHIVEKEGRSKIEDFCLELEISISLNNPEENTKTTLPTPEEFLENHLEISYFYDDKTNQMVCFAHDIQKAMIEYAQIHTKYTIEHKLLDLNNP